MRSKRGWGASKTGFVAGMTRVFSTRGFDAEGYCKALFALPPTSQKFHDSDKKPDAGFFRAYRAEYAQIGREACACVALRKVHAIVDLALMIQKRFNALKGPSRLDNGDLLMKCAEALKDNPSIAQAYRDRFKLIMIDEFQDTDKLQVSIVERIARRPSATSARSGTHSKAFTASEGRTSTCSSSIARRCVACRIELIS